MSTRPRLFAGHGLVYLAEELRYDTNQHDEDVPTIGLLCVQLAASMSANGYEALAGVQAWLFVGRNDPFPEVRSEVDSWDSEEDNEPEENDLGID